jgi:hypothetical protein
VIRHACPGCAPNVRLQRAAVVEPSGDSVLAIRPVGQRVADRRASSIEALEAIAPARWRGSWLPRYGCRPGFFVVMTMTPFEPRMP